MAALLGGALWALRPRSAGARVLSPATTMVIAVPEFVIATLLVLAFSLGTGWFPAVTITDSAGGPLDSSMLVLPVIALAIPQSGWNIRVTRAALHEAAQAPHVLAAVLDGLPHRHVLLRHILPIALPTIATSLATSVGMLLGGALVVETIFNYPGIGSVLSGSVADRDAALVASVVALTGAAITCVLLAADLLRAWSVRGAHEPALDASCAARAARCRRHRAGGTRPLPRTARGGRRCRHSLRRAVYGGAIGH